jgi:hypothetical protein
VNAELDQQDRAAERRIHAEEFIRRKPYLHAEYERQWESMRDTLNDAQRKHLTRQYLAEPEPITAMGDFVSTPNFSQVLSDNRDVDFDEAERDRRDQEYEDQCRDERRERIERGD